MDEKYGESTGCAAYDPETGTYRASYDSTEPYSLTYTILELAEAATDRSQDMMEPLFEVIDPDALEMLFRSHDEPTARLEFRYLDCEVVVLNTGEVSVTSSNDDR